MSRERKKYKVLSVTIMNVKDEIVAYIADLNDPGEAWVKLQKLYANENPARTMYLSNKLQALTLEEGKPISELLHQVKDVTSQLGRKDG